MHAFPDRENKSLSVHLMAHYRYWAAQGISLPPGHLGENLLVDGLEEWEVCVGDVVQIGTVTVQVSRPRIPCQIQARRVGRADWVQRTIQARRTGFYLRVLQPGRLQRGNRWRLIERPHPNLSIDTLNRLAYFPLDVALAREAVQAEAL
ncbi:MAG: MOSC domain-containing protein, partial [Calditrichaeota bacterium]